MRWWEEAVVYEIYVRSFADLGGDGIGDLPGITSRLEYLQWLGVDAIWITPFYASPMADHGYDVADYRAVDPMFGDLRDADALIRRAHELGIRVIVDVVPNHTSDQHTWFQKAIGDPSHPDRQKYLFRDPGPDGGPPNNWVSVFGGPAWTLDERSGQYYLHLFTPEQPDLNWRHPEVHEEFDSILRFWLDRGVDGFRIDVAHGLYKDEQLRSHPEAPDRPPGTQYQGLAQNHAFDQPEVHDVYRRWRSIADSYPGDRVLVGEVFLFDPKQVALYVRPDELHLAFNFYLMGQRWDAAGIRQAVEASMAELDAVGARITWVLSNHDLIRHPTRYGGGEQGARRARAILPFLLALPGAVFLYQGEELGLEEVVVPDEAKQDPIFFRTKGEKAGRDGCRVPIPWRPEPPGFGFTEGDPWLPMPSDWGPLSIDSQRPDPDSFLSFYRSALSARKESTALREGKFSWHDSPEGSLAFIRKDGGSSVLCACNFGDKPVTIDVRGELMLSSSPLVSLDGGQPRLPSDTSAWIELA